MQGCKALGKPSEGGSQGREAATGPSEGCFQGREAVGYSSEAFFDLQTEYPTAPINSNKISNELKEVT